MMNQHNSKKSSSANQLNNDNQRINSNKGALGTYILPSKSTRRCFDVDTALLTSTTLLQRRNDVLWLHATYSTIQMNSIDHIVVKPFHTVVFFEKLFENFSTSFTTLLKL